MAYHAAILKSGPRGEDRGRREGAGRGGERCIQSAKCYATCEQHLVQTSKNAARLFRKYKKLSLESTESYPARAVWQRAVNRRTKVETSSLYSNLPQRAMA
ncbi:hypothetical protein CBL_00508 [Carabus blaptoides fortunei]